MHNQVNFEEMLRFNQVFLKIIQEGNNARLKELYQKTSLPELLQFTINWHVMRDQRDNLSGELKKSMGGLIEKIKNAGFYQLEREAGPLLTHYMHADSFPILKTPSN